jgi:hypothetical protein
VTRKLSGVFVRFRAFNNSRCVPLRAVVIRADFD